MDFHFRVNDKQEYHLDFLSKEKKNKQNMHENIVAAPQLAEQGKQKIEWVKRYMPILRQIENDFANSSISVVCGFWSAFTLKQKQRTWRRFLLRAERKSRLPEAIRIQPKTMS
jgi:hypothetical protein